MATQTATATRTTIQAIPIHRDPARVTVSLTGQAVYGVQMLFEDHVVDAVCEHLHQNGWTIVSRAYANQRGDDVVAERDGVTLRVEAKGETSSNPNSSRFGLPFDGTQRDVNVGEAVLRSMKVISASSDHVGVALPGTPEYRSLVDKVLPALQRLSIRVFLVRPDRAVDEL